MFIKSSESYSLSSSNQKRIIFIIQFQKIFSSFNRNLPNIYISSKQASSNFLHCLHCDGITHTGTNALNKYLAKFFYYDFFYLFRIQWRHILNTRVRKSEKEGKKENKESSNSVSTLPLAVTSIPVVLFSLHCGSSPIWCFFFFLEGRSLPTNF